MELKAIKSKKEYEACLHLADELLDKKVNPNSPEGEELQVVLLLIKQYEDAHYLVPAPKILTTLSYFLI